MVAVKEAVNSRANPVTEDLGTRRIATSTSFKIYTEDRNVKGRGRLVSNSNAGKEMLKPARGIFVPVHEKNAKASASHTKTVEKPQSKHHISVEPGTRRHAFADVTNLQGSFLRKEKRDGSKLTVLSGTIASASLRKVSSGTSKETQSDGVSCSHKCKQSTADLKATLNEKRGKVQPANIGRRAAVTRFTDTRKSLPVLKRFDKVVSGAAKANNGSSERAKGKDNVSVKSKVGQNVVPQASQGRNHLLRQRASDSFTTMVPKARASAESSTFSRNSIRRQTIVKTSVAALNARRTSSLNSRADSNKFVSVARIPLKKKEGIVISTLSQNISSGVSENSRFVENAEEVISEVHNEPTQEDVSSDKDGNLNLKPSGVIVRRKSSRRRSFTSDLMKGSKFLEKHGEAMKKEELPSIDDHCNQLEVSEYIDEIYHYYWVSEAQNPSLGDYMKIQTDITSKMRGILINWLIEVHFKFDLMHETLYLTITLLDRYLSLVTIKKNEMQLVGLTALLLASKYEDFWHPRIKDLISVSAESYTRDQLLGMEKLILNKLKFRLNSPTIYVFMLRFLKAAQSDKKLENLAFFLVELCLVEYEALNFKPSLICASAIYVARCTLQLTPTWTPLLSKHARYDEWEIRDCAAMILRFHKAAKKRLLNVTYEKYMRPELGGVSRVKPLDKI